MECSHKVYNTFAFLLFPVINQNAKTIPKYQSLNQVDSAVVELVVTDINDKAPVFTQKEYNFAVTVDAAVGTFIGEVTVSYELSVFLQLTSLEVAVSFELSEVFLQLIYIREMTVNYDLSVLFLQLAFIGKMKVSCELSIIFLRPINVPSALRDEQFIKNTVG